MRAIYEDPTSKAILLVDASNAFNSLNRQKALLNIHSLCPSLAIALTNTYRKNACLFIGGETFLSSEGTTQGDPLAAAMYSLGVIPQIGKLNHLTHQLWVAGDGAAGGNLSSLLAWWENLNDMGPAFGYYPNAEKSWLVVKDEHVKLAEELFSPHKVNLTTAARKHLGSAIGGTEFIDLFFQKKIIPGLYSSKPYLTS